MSFLEERAVICPYCGEDIIVLIDSSIDFQEYYEDCSVCCSPIFFSVSNHDDAVIVDIKKDDE